jgi:hypothetical protein
MEARDKVDMMMAEAHQPSALMVSADQLDPSLLSLDSAQASVAGPDSIYVSSIMYDGQSYSALLRYRGGTTATVEQVFGPNGTLIPDSLNLARTELSFEAPDVLNISFVELGGQGYSGQLRYVGDNRLELVGMQQVTLPPTAAELAQTAADTAVAAANAAVGDALAAAAAAMSDAEASADAARVAVAEAVDAKAMLMAMMEDLEARVQVPTGIDPNLLNLDDAEVSIAGPDSIYISGIKYGDQEFSARLRYAGDNQGVAEALFGNGVGAIPDMDLSAPALEVVGPDTLVISNVGIRGTAYAVSLKITHDGAIVVSTEEQGHPVRTAAELMRDDLLSSGNRVVSGFADGDALSGEGAWTSGADSVSQTDADTSHAKWALMNVAQPAVATLYGVAGRTSGNEKVGLGLHFLASGTPQSGNTWNYGRSYLMWITQEENFYGTDETQAQLYESLDGNRLVWLKSRNVARPLDDGVTLEALYNPDGCPEGVSVCYGSITLMVDGMEQFKVRVTSDPAERAPDTIALRALGGPVEFTDLYVYSR